MMIKIIGIVGYNAAASGLPKFIKIKKIYYINNLFIILIDSIKPTDSIESIELNKLDTFDLTLIQ